MLGKGWGISIRNKYSFYNRMLLIQYGCNKTYVLLTLIIDFDFVHMATLSLELSLYQEREREREREIVETITGAGDD